MAARSVRYTSAPQSAPAATPTRPVPAPSSRTFLSGCSDLLLKLADADLDLVNRWSRHCMPKFSSFLEMTYDVPQVLRPRLSPVRGGSRMSNLISGKSADAGTIQVRVISGIASELVSARGRLMISKPGQKVMWEKLTRSSTTLSYPPTCQIKERFSLFLCRQDVSIKARRFLEPFQIAGNDRHQEPLDNSLVTGWGFLSIR